MTPPVFFRACGALLWQPFVPSYHEVRFKGVRFETFEGKVDQ